MRKTYQFSIFGAESGKGLLFSAEVLRQYYADHATTPIPNEEERRAKLRAWTTSIEGSRDSESALESRFHAEVLGGVLDYVTHPDDSGASLYVKPPSRVTGIGRTPDGALGTFLPGELLFTAVLELKSPGADLDHPQLRERSETPVEQAFHYGRYILGVRWVLVSDMRIIRLYSVESPVEYEEFDLRLCASASPKGADPFRRLYFMLSRDYLVRGHDQAPAALLLGKTAERQIAIRDSFYATYYQIRAELHRAIAAASTTLPGPPTPAELLAATQRLLDRMLFIFYCEDHPQRLIEPDTVKRVTEGARAMPGPHTGKVYEGLKALFLEVDRGSPPLNRIKIPAYNGELFKAHPILEQIELPDSLHDQVFYVEDGTGVRRRIQGVWGLFAFDFWKELNEHLLGHIFEQSLSDLTPGPSNAAEAAWARMEERRRNGVFYTSSLLSDYLADGALRSLLDECTPIDASDPSALQRSAEGRLKALMSLRAIDPACGSGAFLVSVYRHMLEEYWRVRALLSAKRPGNLFDEVFASDQAELLRTSLYGVDLLPQAVEIAKLALWLRSARKAEKVADLGGNIVAADTLLVESLEPMIGKLEGSFDLVIGNPPWGGEVAPSAYGQVTRWLGIEGPRCDSWELFLLLGLRCLRPGGRLAFVVPDSFLYEGKSETRKRLLQLGELEKVVNLGPDWFGSDVRMGTVAIQVRRGDGSAASFLGANVAGALRTAAIRGQVPLTQVEARSGKAVSASLVRQSATARIEVSRGVEDDAILNQIESRSIALDQLTHRGRGEEINKAGLIWICPSCLAPTTPGEKRKGGGYRSKACPSCGLELRQDGIQERSLIHVGARPLGGSWEPFYDGDDVVRRFAKLVPNKWLDLSLEGWPYKEASLYRGPKILVRQAGVGVVATLDVSDARCPQSVYVYRLDSVAAADGYSHAFLLGCLLSRTMAYVVFQRFGEIDPAKAHAKLTHERLAALPIPRVDWSADEHRRLHQLIARNAEALLAGGARLGGAEDRELELALRTLWGISATQGAQMNRELLDLPPSQVIRDLFPDHAGQNRALGLVSVDQF